MSWTSSETSRILERGRRTLHRPIALARDSIRGVHTAVDALGRGLHSYWLTRSLAQQFATVAALVLVAGMTVLGFWVSERIKQGVMHNSAASGALLMDSYIAPMVQELATGDEISSARRDALDRVLKQSAMSRRVSAIKIWRH